MPLNVQEIVEACEVLALQEKLKICITNSAKAAAIAGFGSFLGGVLMGPPGLAVGSAVGGVVAYAGVPHYEPIWKVILQMNETDKELLANHIRNVLNELDVTDAALLMAIVRGPPCEIGRNALVTALKDYFKP